MLLDYCNLPMLQACFWTQPINLLKLECDWVNFVFDPHPLTKAILDYTVGMFSPHPWTSVTTSEGTVCLGLMYFYFQTSMTKAINGLKAKYHIFLKSEDLLYITERLHQMFVFFPSFVCMIFFILLESQWSHGQYTLKKSGVSRVLSDWSFIFNLAIITGLLGVESRYII